MPPQFSRTRIFSSLILPITGLNAFLVVWRRRVRRTISQHLGILEAVLAADLALAVARFGRHLGESMAVVEDRATRALARMASGKGAMRA